MPLASADQVREARGNATYPLGDLPLIVLTSGVAINGTCEMAHLPESSAACKSFQDEIKCCGQVHYDINKDFTTLSSDSEWRIIWNASHNIAIDDPNAVIKAIQDTFNKIN
eukprot:TRINITY_DN28649_c0_g1_i1.p1 TRINITY_DN28649_c0_g1~~TRINITY_DN28649_c0_g1_i1.p1  ORF type:complete len:129 (+),score=8.59 TRINITY_DN28649_c0_g1_i1:57-389(+)